MDEAAVQRLAGTVPACFRTQISAWIRVLRGEGTRPSPVMSWRTIRRHVGAVLPSLHQWASEQITSLREVTTEDVTTATAR
jgi:hypothetical protein